MWCSRAKTQDNQHKNSGPKIPREGSPCPILRAWKEKEQNLQTRNWRTSRSHKWDREVKVQENSGFQ